MNYESYIKNMKNENINSMPMTCPKCGGDLDFGDYPDETYMGDGRFLREEDLICCECDFQMHVSQWYVPSKLTIEIEEEA